MASLYSGRSWNDPAAGARPCPEEVDMNRWTCVLIAIIAFFASLVAGVRAFDAARASYVANDPYGRNVVLIESRAFLETILTRTNQVTGELRVNPKNILDEPLARFQVDLGSLDTGIPLRNEHLRSEEWLDTNRYPKAVFSLKRVLSPREPTPLRTGEVLPLEVEGTMELHGVTRPVRARVELKAIPGDENTARRLPGNLLHVRAQFPLRLADFGIKIPRLALQKVADEQQVTVDVFTSNMLLNRVR